MDLIVFQVAGSRYALEIENIQRIIQATQLTTVPNAPEIIDGMFNYENNIIKVVSFRKLIGLRAYEMQLRDFFIKQQTEYRHFMDTLKDSLERGAAFNRALNPHKCELGIWLKNFNSYDEGLSKILKNLLEDFRRLYALASDALELSKSDANAALELFNLEIQKVFHQMIQEINLCIEKLETAANSLQKMIIYRQESARFAIKVDAIEDIVHAEEEQIMRSDENDSKELQLYGVLDVGGNLVNIIKNINIASKGELHGN
ncbi:chemotaxis protein CheW [bacterium]|nr:chemotaxis protein CheW [bacterium]MBU1994604.1 chemotaxis protein CheW [bacterium]